MLLGGIEENGVRAVEEIFAVRNAREADARGRRFRMEPEDFLRAERGARKQGRDIVGFYHSHPDHQALPSAYDLDHALPFYSYIIVAVELGKAAELTSWELARDRSGFLQER
jgi:proteasome lid subunit RPN8/RPN11